MEGIYSESYNLAPTQKAFTVSNIEGKRILKQMKWGLIPSWAKAEKVKTGLINARFETLTEKPSFRNSYKHRRCIVPVTGFFEWKKEGKLKTPYFISRGKDNNGYFIPMLLCGLYDRSVSSAGETVETFAIITTESSGRMKTIHERMPLILNDENMLLWLGGDYSHELHQSTIKAFDAERLVIYPVSEFINSPTNNSIKCIESVEF